MTNSTASSPAQPLLMALVRAIYLFQGKEYDTVGRVVLVQSVFGSDKLRLTLEREDGTHQRCYTRDDSWKLEILGGSLASLEAFRAAVS